MYGRHGGGQTSQLKASQDLNEWMRIGHLFTNDEYDAAMATAMAKRRWPAHGDDDGDDDGDDGDDDGDDDDDDDGEHLE